jgi:hypothetical protein
MIAHSANIKHLPLLCFCYTLLFSINQFARVLGGVSLLPTDTRLAELLFRRYAVYDTKHRPTDQQSFVDYRRFLADIDVSTAVQAQAAIRAAATSAFTTNTRAYDSIAVKGAAASKSVNGTIQSSSVVTRDYDTLLSTLRKGCLVKRRALEPLLRDFDQLRHGVITCAQLGRVLNTAGHSLSDAELAILCGHYKHVPTDAKSTTTATSSR